MRTEITAPADPERRNRRDRIVWFLNMVIAVPFFFLLGRVIFFLGYNIALPRSNPPFWALCLFPTAFSLALWGLWCRYQYRLLIRKIPRPPHETLRTLLLFAGCAIAAVAIVAVIVVVEILRFYCQ